VSSRLDLVATWSFSGNLASCDISGAAILAMVASVGASRSRLIID
jgi:hypothetical protein